MTLHLMLGPHSVPHLSVELNHLPRPVTIPHKRRVYGPRRHFKPRVLIRIEKNRQREAIEEDLFPLD